MAQASLTARRTCQADGKPEHSEPTFRIRCGRRLTDKSYSRDNRLVPPKSSYRRRSSAPRCRLILSWGWRRSQGFGCSPIKKIRELGSDRSKANTCIGWGTVWIKFWNTTQSGIFVLIKNKMSPVVRLIIINYYQDRTNHCGGHIWRHVWHIQLISENSHLLCKGEFRGKFYRLSREDKL